MKKHKFSFDPISLVVWIWLFVVLGYQSGLAYLFAIVFHEGGHYLVAKKLGYKLDKFSISAYGVSLSYFDQNINRKDELEIALAGPLVNLIFALLTVAFWWIYPATYFFTEAFVKISVILALTNLLPCYPLDGGRMFVDISSSFLSEKLAKKITVIFNVFLSILFMIMFLFLCFQNFNPTFFLFSFFLIFGALDLTKTSKYEKINIFQKQTKNFSKIEFLYVTADTTLQKMLDKMSSSKTVVFCLVLENGKVINLSEKFVLKLLTIFSLDTKLCDIFAKQPVAALK